MESLETGNQHFSPCSQQKSTFLKHSGLLENKTCLVCANIFETLNWDQPYWCTLTLPKWHSLPWLWSQLQLPNWCLLQSLWKERDQKKGDSKDKSDSCDSALLSSWQMVIHLGCRVKWDNWFHELRWWCHARQEVRIHTPSVYELNNHIVVSLCIDNELIYSFSGYEPQLS